MNDDAIVCELCMLAPFALYMQHVVRHGGPAAIGSTRPFSKLNCTLHEARQSTIVRRTRLIAINCPRRFFKRSDVLTKLNVREFKRSGSECSFCTITIPHCINIRIFVSCVPFRCRL